jgi:hypothetical protein
LNSVPTTIGLRITGSTGPGSPVGLLLGITS